MDLIRLIDGIHDSLPDGLKPSIGTMIILYEMS